MRGAHSGCCSRCTTGATRTSATQGVCRLSGPLLPARSHASSETQSKRRAAGPPVSELLRHHTPPLYTTVLAARTQGCAAACRYVCDERWYNITRSIRLKGAMGLAAQEALKQPTWCRLPPESFATLVQRASPKFPENILFTYTSETPLIAVSERGLKHSNATLSSSSSDRAVNGSDVLQ